MLTPTGGFEPAETAEPMETVETAKPTEPAAAPEETAAAESDQPNTPDAFADLASKVFGEPADGEPRSD